MVQGLPFMFIQMLVLIKWVRNGICVDNYLLFSSSLTLRLLLLLVLRYVFLFFVEEARATDAGSKQPNDDQTWQRKTNEHRVSPV